MSVVRGVVEAVANIDIAGPEGVALERVLATIISIATEADITRLASTEARRRTCPEDPAIITALGFAPGLKDHKAINAFLTERW